MKFILSRGTKIDRECKICKGIIRKGDTTEYYSRVANIDYAPRIENICLNCIKAVIKAS